MDEIARILRDQSGVVARWQVLALGGRPHDIQRALRRREWASLLPGIYVDHTGDPTWLQRAWGGVLHYTPAALGGDSALRAVTGPGWVRYRDDGPIEIAVDVSRTVRRVPGFVPVRLTGLADSVVWAASPPRVRPERAVITVAARTRGELARIGLLADACQSRRTTATRLLDELDTRTRVTGRAWLRAVLVDIADGTCSVLEHGYLTRVERAHGLPHGLRQEGAVTAQGVVQRDVEYRRERRYVELDGRLFHDSADQRDRDLDRDLDSAVLGRDTVRLGWGQVFGRPCWTAYRIGALLRQGGWDGSVGRCGPTRSIVV